MRRIVSEVNDVKFLIDEEFKDLLDKYKYYPRKNKNRTYMTRFTWDGKKQKQIRLHQDIVESIIGGRIKGKVVDHINGDPLDNTVSNLRIVTNQQNIMNMKKSRKGVSFCNKRYLFRAYIMKNSKQKHLGYFNTPEEAQKAYNLAAVELFGEYACPV